MRCRTLPNRPPDFVSDQKFLGLKLFFTPIENPFSSILLIMYSYDLNPLLLVITLLS